MKPTESVKIRNPWTEYPEFYLVSHLCRRTEHFLFYSQNGHVLVVDAKTNHAVSQVGTAEGFFRGLANPHSPVGRGHRLKGQDLSGSATI